MSFPRYPEYKDSGIPWLARLPTHWHVSSLKRVASLRSGESITSEDIDASGPYPVYGGNGLRGWTSSYTHEGRFALIGRQGALCGNINYADGRFWASEHAVVATPVKPLVATWLGELLRAMNLNQYSVSAAQPGLSVEAISNLRIPYPPIAEQSAISAFLDHETAKIDALIGEQERLIALLAEKRLATISHAVTRGLNPDVRTKNAGVSWLGCVPAEWPITRIKHLVGTIEQGWSPQCENGPVEGPEEWGVLKVGCVNGGVFSPSENKKLPKGLEPIPSYGLQRDDVLISRANTRELVGSAALVLADFPRLLLCDKLYRLRLHEGECLPPFLIAYLQTPEARAQIELEATGASSSMLNIGQSVILNLCMGLPTLAEQDEILAFVARETNRVEELSLNASRAVALLKERRAALITAAVTGQIDVRGLVHPSESTAVEEAMAA